MIYQLKRKQGLVVDTISSLASSNGFYSRLWRDLKNAMNRGEDLTDFWDQFNECETQLDVIMVLEGQGGL